ncbi:MAG: transcription-repair coupling factor, partial [Candidatus Nucleicultricaceae bacterium]
MYFDFITFNHDPSKQTSKIHHKLQGLEAFYIGSPAFEHQSIAVYVLTDETRIDSTYQLLRFLNPSKEVLVFPAWDVVPYDRASPNRDVMADRVQLLNKLCSERHYPLIILTTINALCQKIPPLPRFKNGPLLLRTNDTIHLEQTVQAFTSKGYRRVEIVREPGEFVVRGSILDLFPASDVSAYRLDLFGDTIETIKTFDPTTQRSIEVIEHIQLTDTSELQLTDDTVRRFRQRFVELFGTSAVKSELYELISAFTPVLGMEHLLPLFFEQLDTFFDFLPEDALFFLDEQWQDALGAREELVLTHYQARQQDINITQDASLIYYAVPPTLMFLPKEDLVKKIHTFKTIQFDRFRQTFDEEAIDSPLRLTLTPKFSTKKDSEHLYENLITFIRERQSKNKDIILCFPSPTAQTTILHAFKSQNLFIETIDSVNDLPKRPKGKLYMCPLSLEQGFEANHYIFLTEEDVFGEKLARPYKRKRKASLFIKTFQSLSVGDYVVHQDHGIGRYDGLITLMINNLPHDCLRVVYANDDKVFVPVENLEVLTRYGSDDTVVQLDRLGAASWQTRKARVKKNLLEIADQLVKIAAQRKAQHAPICSPLSGLYDVFCGQFPYVETDDQLRAIEETLQDLESGTPMDRLVCGDVGFGKTEVAMRAACVAAVNGYQVALLAPTTLLAHQHYKNFVKRFEGFALKIEQLSRLTPKSAIPLIHSEAERGSTSVVIGTHSILNNNLRFKNLGLVIVDEEQHFGVKQKEKLKKLYPNIHVLALSATPIPRTLQLSLSGVRDLSIIATPPVDRMSVNTFVLPFDALIIREALMREKYRQGQSFYVSPRIEYLNTLYETLQTLIPELKIAVAHGQMPAKHLEKVMFDFHDKKYDVLLATNIIESGLDIPTVNTIIIDRADLFGLSQLYQLRGRVGRSKTRAYAYLTIPNQKLMSEKSLKRLEVMQSLDTLGAGFQLASYDMDIRGAGNILGEAQSGHVREVGVELYQQLLEEAV